MDGLRGGIEGPDEALADRELARSGQLLTWAGQLSLRQHAHSLNGQWDELRGPFGQLVSLVLLSSIALRDSCWPDAGKEVIT
ncbi:hypothetical protein SBI_05313 [Streptomyces bingchenggensis BCW-1]|uniref:Uncharacterized protein n=1 Tax=Streptomyces bingchenggensis (strain BCW-1) TaxID=749414 RepID=D7C746_STRBB|nr:hypothetical protein SBI_05313 [Streptomyces bingchenggensis BCW-1]